MQVTRHQPPQRRPPFLIQTLHHLRIHQHRILQRQRPRLIKHHPLQPQQLLPQPQRPHKHPQPLSPRRSQLLRQRHRHSQRTRTRHHKHRNHHLQRTRHPIMPPPPHRPRQSHHHHHRQIPPQQPLQPLIPKLRLPPRLQQPIQRRLLPPLQRLHLQLTHPHIQHPRRQQLPSLPPLHLTLTIDPLQTHRPPLTQQPRRHRQRLPRLHPKTHPLRNLRHQQSLILLQ